MPELTAGRVAEITGGRLIGDGRATGHTVVHDSRTVVPGAIFAAVHGGHAFIQNAVAAGAPFVIAEESDGVFDGVIVRDTVRALMSLASAVRDEMSARVVGITGSTGKTLTKDLVAAVLGSRFKVHASQRSFNAELGLPLVIFSAPDDAEVLVLELAARHAGEIAELAAIARPQTGIITGIGITHLEEFGSRDAIAQTKSELLAALPADGLAIVPSNDDYLALLSESTPARLRTVGPGAAIDYRATKIDSSGRTYGVVTVDGTQIDVSLPIAGRALMRNIALAVACGIEHGVEPGDAASAIEDAPLSSFRMEIVEVDGWTIVNDAYNSNPTSASSALRSVREMAQGRPVWAVLGPMAELGPVAEDAHLRIGRLAADLAYDGVIALGDEATEIAHGAGSLARVVTSADDAADAVIGSVPPGALVLAKASRVVSLERFPEILRARLHSAERKA